MINILIVQPVFDEATQLQSEVMKDFALNNDLPDNIEIYVLWGDYATRDNFLKYYNELNPKMIVFGGHGDYNKIFGQDGKVLITKEDLYLFNDKIVYSFNCLFGNTLMKSRYPKVSYGYTKDFLIDTDNPDIIISIGLYPVYFLGWGYDAIDSYKLTISEYNKYLSNAPKDSLLYYSLKNNRDSFIIAGDPTARLY